VDQVEKRHAEAAVPLRVADDEAQVALDEPADGGLVAVVAGCAAERLLLVGVSARDPRDGSRR
jgi:hypothetical protein